MAATPSSPRHLALGLLLALALGGAPAGAPGQGQGLSDRPAQEIGLPPPWDGAERPFLVTDPGGHTAPVKAAFFLPGGDNVVTVSIDRSVRVWDVAGAECLQTFRFPTDAQGSGLLQAGDVSPDGRLLAVGGMTAGGGKQGDLVYLLALDAGQVSAALKGHADAVTGVQFSHDGARLASCSIDGTARVYDVKTGKTLHVLRGHRQRLRRVAFAHDDRYLATTSLDGSVRV